VKSVFFLTCGFFVSSSELSSSLEDSFFAGALAAGFTGAAGFLAAGFSSSELSSSLDDSAFFPFPFTIAFPFVTGAFPFTFGAGVSSSESSSESSESAAVIFAGSFLGAVLL
jgi:hypothetical protein